MARRRRRKRRSTKKKEITYDSRETRTVVGLFSILGGIVFLIAFLVEPNQPNMFTQLRIWFGEGTVITSIFLFSLGFRLFGTELPFAKSRSVIAQGFLVLLVPAFLASTYSSERAAETVANQGQAGGQLGYVLAFQLFEDTLVFGQYTRFILGFAILIFAPIAISISVAKIVDYLMKFGTWLGKGMKTLFTQVDVPKVNIELANSTDNKKTKTSGKEESGQPQTTKRFGDFQRQFAKPAEATTKNTDSSKAIAAVTSTQSSKQQTLDEIAENADVQIKEAEMGEDGLSQSELKYPDWKLPPISLLSPYKRVKPQDSDTQRNAEIIEQTLASFSIDAEVAEAYIGPSVVRYALSIPLGTKVSKISGLSPTLALGLGVDSAAVRVDTIPGTTYLGIEVPRQNRDFVQIRELVEEQLSREKKPNLPVTIGKDIDGKAIIDDIQKMPHLLIAGATGSGKSILTNAFITTLLMNRTPDELRLILVDPKQVELMDYNGIPHLLTPVITDMDKVVNALKWAVNEMEQRYSVLASKQVRNIEEYNKKLGFAAMPYIVVVIDEMADMMMTANKVEAENAIVRLTQKARAVGIHLILATQRPSVNVITGLIKANVPARIGMSVASNTDSRVILDASGAESLMGKGDLLYNSPGVAKMQRLQSPFISGEEIMRVVEFIKTQVPEVEYVTSILEDTSPGSGNPDGGLAAFSEDDQFSQAVQIIVNSQKGSASFLQRKLNVGFNRAARLLEEMEELGIVGPPNGSKPRDVLITDANEFLASMKENA